MKSRLKDTLLLIGGSNSDRSRLHEIFDGSYYLLEADSAFQGVMLLEQNSDCIAAVLADIPLGNGDALRALVEACHRDTAAEIPVLAVIEPMGEGQGEELAFLVGAADVVRKPYTTLSIRRRVQVLTDLYSHRWHLEKLVEQQNQTIRNANQTVLDTLSAIIEHRSTESGNHVLRIRRFTQRLLQELARSCPEYGLNETDIDSISSAAVLHDIGKISIPDAILNKPGKLTAEEFEVMKTHTTVGGQLVEQLEGLKDILFLRYGYNICLYHHERWDGRGYPKGLAGDEIPICAQVVGLTDAFDALTTYRVYKPAFEYETAINMILNGECGAFSPKLLECFKHVQQELVAIARRYADGYSPKSDPIRVPLPGPERQALPLDAMQLAHLKYQALLHHLNDTIIELDVDNKVYHVVYNPNPDFVSMLSNASFDEIAVRLLAGGLHPEDANTVDELQALFAELLFRQNRRKCAFRCRIYSPPKDEYLPYQVTLLRVNTRNVAQRIVLALFHDLSQDAPQDSSGTPEPASVLFDLQGAPLCCREDPEQTILEGANALLHLTGFSPREIASRFGGSLKNMILPEDRPILEEMLGRGTDVSEKDECLYRICHRSGGFLWVIDRCRVQLAPDGTEHRFHVLTDVTAYKQEQDRLEAAYNRNQVLISQTEGIIFEWDLQSDTLHCSEKLRERFGYGTENPNFRRQLESGYRFHPDDAPLLAEKYAELLRRPHTADADARILTREGRYLWSRLRATSVFDDSGRPTHIIGIIHDINELKSDALELKKQAERDSLTKLLNKASTQQAISDYLESRSGDTQAAMLVLDLDNFKTVNDTHGHLYGDAVLTHVGNTLMSLFRVHDVIGRVGGDEFLIFLRGVPSADMVRERCQLLLNTFRSQLQQLMPGLPVSVSIGCALAPAHGDTFADLFRHADEALYSSKRKGKNRFAIYNPQEKYEELLDAASHTTRIDSDELPVMNDDSLLRFVFRSLYESRNIDATIDELLALIGTRFNVSRVYIFENNDDNTCCSNTFEWCNSGITPEKENLQNVSYITDIPGWPDVYDDRGVLYCTDVTQLAPTARNVLEPQGIKSMLHCAIMDRGIFRGYVGFDECTSNRLWTEGQVSTLEFLAEVLAVFLIKQRTLDKLQAKTPETC